MARLPRIDLAGVPQHLIQRGNNRQACFFADIDYRVYLEALTKAATKYGCAVHAYVLMTNHVHLLVTGDQLGALGRMMQSVGRRYVRYINSTYQRSGTLWEGRYKSSLIDTQRYLMTCYRYIELNPVRARMVPGPGEYRWSSYHANALGAVDDLITPHAVYKSLGSAAAVRQAAYRQLFDSAVDPDDVAAIRAHVNQGRVLGSSRFQSQVEAQLNRRVAARGPGRPKKAL